MTTNRKYILAYCSANKGIAREIEKNLGKVDFEFEHVSCDEFEDGETFFNKLQLKDLPTIILYSDNFFKTETCMLDALKMLQNTSIKRQLIPIVTDGRSKKDGDVNYIYTPTEFTRVSNVIHYMNYWQDQYLDLRKQRKNIGQEEEEIFGKELQKIKSISGEIGEFLRLLRDADYGDYVRLKENNYEKLFRKLGQAELHQVYVNLGQTPLKTATPTSNLIEDIINENADEILNENEESVVKESHLATNGILITGEKLKDIASTKSVDAVTDITSPDEEIQKVEPVIEPEPKEKKPFFERIVSQLEGKIEQQVGESKSMHYIEDLREKEVEVELQQETTIDAEAEVLEDLQLEEPINTDSIVKNLPESEEDYPEIEILPSSINKESNLTKDADIEALMEEDLFSDEEMMAEIKSKIDATPMPVVEDVLSDMDSVEEEVLSEEVLLTNDYQPELLSAEDYASYRAELQQAKALIDQNMIVEGIAIYESLIVQYPSKTEVRLLYAANLAKRMHDHDKASKELEKILEINNEDADAYHLLAEIAESHKDYILAKSYYEKAVSIDSNYPNVYYKLGRILANQFPNQKKLAAKYFSNSIKQNNRHVDAHYQYALLLNEHFGKYSKAIKHFKKTLKLNPLHPFAAYDLALLYHKLYEPNMAASFYQKACKNNPELKTAQNDAVFLELKVNNIANMTPIEAFEKGLEFEDRPAKMQITADSEPAIPQVDKVVFITGATSGIGKATAAIFAQNGYRLILTGRRAERLAEMQADFEERLGSDILVLPFDVRDAVTVKSIIEDLDEEWKNIDVLINNAGLAKGFSAIHEGDLEDWETMIDTNIKGLLYMTRAIAPHMVKRRSGHIINICSTAGKEVYPKGNVYCATKFAVDALTKTMRLDLYKHNIKVSQISPAHVEQTEFAQVRFDGDTERAKIYNDFNPLTAHDVAESIYFIATRPGHVLIRDITLSGNQQASSTDLDRSGRIYDEEE